MKRKLSTRFEFLESRVLFAAGDLDIALNDNHLVTTAFGVGHSHVNDVATLSDGGVVAVGQIITKKGAEETAIAEYHFDGSLNTSFGTGGQIVGGLSDMTSLDKVAIGSDGSIYALDGAASRIAKLTSAGTVDGTFGTNGIISFIDINNVVGFTLDSSDNILIAGRRDVTPDSDEPNTTNGDLRRYTSAGKIDPTFHGGSDFLLGPVGTTQTQSQYRTMLFDTPAIDAQGNILLAADDALHANHNGGSIDVANEYLYRITSAGKIDRTFSHFGNTQLPDGSANIAGLTGRGQILIDTNNRLSQYNADGTLDTGYGSNGVSTVDVAIGARAGAGHAFAVAPDGTVTAIASSTDPNANFAIKHLLANGAIDTDFGNNGIVTANGLGQSFADGVTVAPDGTIVIGGQIGSLSPSGKVDTRTFAIGRLYSGKGPAVQLTPRTLKTSSRYLSMTVLIRDNEGVKLNTLDSNDLKLFDADGNTRKIRLLSTKQVDDNGRYIQATYRIVAPNNAAAWSATDNGDYEVRLQKQQIADDNSNFAEAIVLGTLRVKIA